jgi:3-oxoacyl-[acyl-carrier protein] reductase
LLAQGCHVIGAARSESTCEHENYSHVPCDVTSEVSVKTLMGAVRDRFGGLDALINNAGVARMLPFALTPPETARRILEVNYMGTFLVSHSALRLLRKSPHGRIVNFTSIAVPLRLEGEAAYAAAKSAVECLTRVLAKEVGPLGVTCNAVGPSPIRTDLIRSVPEEKLQSLIDQQSIPQWAEPADVANVVDFFLRPESRLITGQIVYLGGFG